MDSTLGNTKKHKTLNKIILAIMFTSLTLLPIFLALRNKNETNEIVIEQNRDVEEQCNNEDIALNKEAYITKFCNLRESPSKSSDKIVICNKGEKVKLLSKISSDWYKVETQDRIGYIQSNYVKFLDDVFIDKNGVVVSSVKIDEVFKYNNNIQPSLINYASNYWYLIPENIREKFKNDDWTIEITDDNLSERYNIEYNILGITLPEEKLIVLSSGQENISKSLLHEVGHFIDYSNEFPSKSKDFDNIYKLESNYVKERFSKVKFNKQEYFAEAFRLFILGDSKSKIALQDTFKYIKIYF